MFSQMISSSGSVEGGGGRAIVLLEFIDQLRKRDSQSPYGLQRPARNEPSQLRMEIVFLPITPNLDLAVAREALFESFF